VICVCASASGSDGSLPGFVQLMQPHLKGMTPDNDHPIAGGWAADGTVQLARILEVADG
jgi:hypothetical protein